VAWAVSAGWGQFQGFCRVAIRHWGVDGGEVVDKQRERETLAGFSQKVCIGLLLPLDANRIGQEEKVV
jgi:hypothetical protein